MMDPTDLVVGASLLPTASEMMGRGTVEATLAETIVAAVLVKLVLGMGMPTLSEASGVVLLPEECSDTCLAAIEGEFHPIFSVVVFVYSRMKLRFARADLAFFYLINVSFDKSRASVFITQL